MENGIFYIVRNDGPGKYRVLKFALGSDGKASRKADYGVADGACTCPGFSFRSRCKHVDAIERGFGGARVPLAEARSTVRALTEMFGDGFRFAGVPDEPYDREDDGSVTCATVVFRMPKDNEPEVPSGVWSGELKEGGLLFRLRVGDNA